jgi:hypothetical protein
MLIDDTHENFHANPISKTGRLLNLAMSPHQQHTTSTPVGKLAASSLSASFLGLSKGETYCEVRRRKEEEFVEMVGEVEKKVFL